MKYALLHITLVLFPVLSFGIRTILGAEDTVLQSLPVVPPGFEVSIFADEPLVRNPCAMAFDARGRLCVSMGPQYRNPKPETLPDSVVILEDTDGDGVADSRKVFATGLNCIQGLAWHGRDLWIANSPDLTIVRDLDGDDVADEYVKVFTDLGNIEHALHGLNWAPDGKLYMSKGNSKGLNLPERYAPKAFRELLDLPAPVSALDMPPPVVFKKGEYRATYHDPADDWGRSGGVLRCDDMGENLEIVARGLRNPWDITFDSDFNWLGTDNDQNEGDRNFMPFHGAHFGWGHGWSADWTGHHHPPTVPITGPTYSGSGTGIVYYDAPQFPEKFRRVFFWNDWLRKATFVYRSQWDGALLKQDGDWEKFADGAQALYRPVDIEVGPDGALWVLGWGRDYGVAWAKDGTQANEGRVFRIAWKGAPLLKWHDAKRARPLDAWTFDELAADLSSHLPVWRVNAQEELGRRGTAVKGGLLALLGRADLSEAAQTWALWTLGRLDKDDADLGRFFTELAEKKSPLNSRLQALRILAHRSRLSAHPLPLVVAASLRDADPRIRFEAVQAIWQARQTAFISALQDLAASETDRVTFYSAWGALRDLAGIELLRVMLRDERAGVRCVALLALADLDKLTPIDAQPLVADLATAEVAALWLTKRSGNPLVMIEPLPGEFDDVVKVRLNPGVKPAQIRYTVDGSMPGPDSPLARDVIVLRETTTLKAVLFVGGKQVGQPAEAVFRKRANPLPAITLTPHAQPTTFEQVIAALPTGDAKRGHAMFFAPGGAGCASCHRVGTEGRVFGPDLSNLGERGDAAALVLAILEPSAIITEGFALQTITLRDGETRAGVLSEETDLHLTLVQPGGEPVRIVKANIQNRASSPISAMPPFGPVLTPAQVADLVAFLSAQKPTAKSSARGFAFSAKDDRLVITHSDRPVVTYVFRDAIIPRPFFTHLHAPDGIQVTRNFPPVKGQDATDHDTMHPGLWLAFGDLNGVDFWRNKGRIEHVRFIDEPRIAGNRLSFAVEEKYLAPDGTEVCRSVNEFCFVAGNTLQPALPGMLLMWDTALRRADGPLTFGPQHEMGLGFRVATPLVVKSGTGSIRSSHGGQNEAGNWGRIGTWWDYSGTIDGRHAGILALAATGNSHAVWSHARDYGFLAMNPTGPPPGAKDVPSIPFTVPAGGSLRLKFGVLLHVSAVGEPLDPAKAAPTVDAALNAWK